MSPAFKNNNNNRHMSPTLSKKCHIYFNNLYSTALFTSTSYFLGLTLNTTSFLIFCFVVFYNIIYSVLFILSHFYPPYFN